MLIQLLFVMLAAMNIAAYFLMWKDKVRAVRHGWRISENTFFLLSLLGGFIGVYCGMKRFRHKTKQCFYPVRNAVHQKAHVSRYSA